VNILNDLLLYEKLEGGIAVLEKRCEPALSVVYDAVKTFNIQALRANVTLEFTFDGAVFSPSELEQPTMFIDVDRPKISQVLRNLVSNAIKFSNSEVDHKRVLVHVSVVEYEFEGGVEDSLEIDLQVGRFWEEEGKENREPSDGGRGTEWH
jgi:signal transduction histidine kinase